MLTSRLLGAVGIVAVVGGVLAAQTPASPVAFEVASIKPNRSGDPVATARVQTGGRLIVNNYPLRGLIAMAFPTPDTLLRRSQMSGGPDWIDTDRFDIDAKSPNDLGADLSLRSPELAEMLRALLVERFKLTTHYESREQAIYALVLARSDGRLGHTLRPLQVDCAALRAAFRAAGSSAAAPPPSAQPICSFAGGTGTLIGRGVPMGQIADRLATAINSPVRDHTSLGGLFDLDLSWTPDQPPPQFPGASDAPPIDSNGPSIFTAVQEQLGLKLESTKEPVDVLVIDHVEHPTED